MGIKKKLIDYTIEEAVNAATVGFGEVDASGLSGSDSVRHALQMVVELKIAKKQDEVNTKLLGLTRWLVILTIAVVVLTLVLIFKV